MSLLSESLDYRACIEMMRLRGRGSPNYLASGHLGRLGSYDQNVPSRWPSDGPTATTGSGSHHACRPGQPGTTGADDCSAPARFRQLRRSGSVVNTRPKVFPTVPRYASSVVPGIGDCHIPALAKGTTDCTMENRIVNSFVENAGRELRSCRASVRISTCNVYSYDASCGRRLPAAALRRAGPRGRRGWLARRSSPRPSP